MVERAESHSRVLCAQAVSAVPLPTGDWEPYPCRREGATQPYRMFASLNATCVTGRRPNSRTGRLNFYDAIAALIQIKVTPARMTVECHCFSDWL